MEDARKFLDSESEILSELRNIKSLISNSDDKVCVIDTNLRTISIPSEITSLGVESDDDVTRLYFNMPKTYGEFDLSTFDIYINYMNANSEGDRYIVNDKTVDNDNIIFSWLVGRNATRYKGTTKFIVCLKKVDYTGEVQQEFNTTVASLPVFEGLETSAQVVQENPDIIEQILKKISEVNTGLPSTNGNGTAGQFLTSNGDGTTTWVSLDVAEGSEY